MSGLDILFACRILAGFGFDEAALSRASRDGFLGNGKIRDKPLAKSSSSVVLMTGAAEAGPLGELAMSGDCSRVGEVLSLTY